MTDTYALIQNGTVVNTIVASSTDPQDPTYVWVDITSLSPRPGIGWTYDGSVFTNPYTPPSPLPLNQQYTAAQYGQMLINEFTAANIARGMTSTQLFTLAQNLSPFYILLQCGSLQAFLDNSSSIPIDGVMMTTGLITEFQQACQAFLSGE